WRASSPSSSCWHSRMATAPLPSLKGVLDLSTWLQVAELEGWTCAVAFEDGSEMRFDEGLLTGAKHAGHAGVTGILGMFLSGRTAGETQPQSSDSDPDLRWDATTASLRGFRLVDEWTRLRAQILAVAGPATQPLGPMEPLFDGQRTVAEVVAESGLPAASACDLVLAALQERALQTAAPPDEARAADALTPVSAEDFWDLLDAAHAFTRAKQLDQAEAVLHKALRARPGDAMAEQNLKRIQRLRSRAQI
ncbi:MAG: hypothetical protein AB8H79_22485, partial [Myxococcota bacterium]